MENRLLIPKMTLDQKLILGATLFILIASFLLEVKPHDSKSVYFRFSDSKIPGMCFSQSLFEQDCPGCGMTRSIVCLSQGELTRSLRFNLAGIFFYTCAIGYVGFILMRTRIPVHHFFHSRRAWPSFVWLGLTLVFFQWSVRFLT